MREQEQKQNEITEQERETLTPDIIYKNNIYALVDDVKQEQRFINKTDEELKNDKSFFPVLVDYIYNNYIGDLLGNKHGKQVVYKDIQQLDNLFNIYTSLVYMYKWNNRPLIIEFSIFTGINRDTFYNWLNGCIDNNTPTENGCRDITREKVDTVRKWVSTCERALVDGTDTIKDIFLLKAKHDYRDNNNVVEVNVNHRAVIGADDLPALIGLKSSNNS